MSVQSEITRIKNGVSAAYTAAEAKGATIPSSKTVANLAATIKSIPEAKETSMEIQSGTVSFPFGPNYPSKKITFSKAFSKKPVVVCSQPFDSTNCNIKTEDVSTTGFTMRMPSLGSSGNRDVMWIAIVT